MQPDDARPAQDQEAPKDNKEHEGEMEKYNEVGKEAIEHWAICLEGDNVATVQWRKEGGRPGVARLKPVSKFWAGVPP